MITMDDVLRLFDRAGTNLREVALVDNEDYQAIVLYLVADPLKVRR